MSAANEPLIVTKECFAAIRETIAAKPAETGGILGSRDGVAVTDLVFDKGKENTAEYYVPDVAALNRAIIDWRRDGIRFIGMIHSHTRGRNMLSYSDVTYARKILESMRLERLYMLLVDTDTVDYGLSVFEFKSGVEPDYTKIEYTVI